MGAHDAVLQKVEYQQEALGRTFEFYLLQVIAVRAGRMYVFSYEILKGDVKSEALFPILQNALTGFVFL